jgi:FixJ family two-component response regulator
MKERQPVVFVVDDDSAVRSSIRMLLKSIGVAATSMASAQEFLDSFDPAQPGCLVLDVRMPGMSGLELQEQLNMRGAILPVIFITGHGDVPMAVEAMQHGAFDFLQKPFRDQDLIDRIQKALARDRETRSELQKHDQIRTRLESLTPRERDVLQLLAQGRQNKVMASELGLSQRTVEIHRAHVMEKMGARSVAQLVRMLLDAQQAH